MKKLILSVFVLAAVAFSVNAAGNTATASGVTAKAKLFKPIGISSSRGLEFGTVAIGSINGTVTVDTLVTTGYHSSDVNAVLVTSGNPQTSAKFTVTGQSGKVFSVTLPSTDVTFGTEATVNNFKSSLNESASTLTGGSVDFYVGATLNYTAANVTGTDLSGTFAVTVTYN
jgi:hypothetical protein